MSDGAGALQRRPLALEGTPFGAASGLAMMHREALSITLPVMNERRLCYLGLVCIALTGCPTQVHSPQAKDTPDIAIDGASGRDGQASDLGETLDAATDSSMSDAANPVADIPPLDVSDTVADSTTAEPEPDLPSTDAGSETTGTDAGSTTFDPESGGGTFYCVGYGGMFITSDDLGQTWDIIGDDGGGGDDATLYRNTHWVGGRYFRVGNNGRGFWTSTDGVTWTDYAEVMGLGQWIGGVAYGQGRWVGAGGCGVHVTSTDGVQWTNTYNLPGQEGCEHARTIAYGNGVFVTIGNNGTDAYWATTVDGESPGHYESTDQWGWFGVVFAFGKFWASLNDGSAVKVSTDGVSWTDAELPANYTWRRLGFAAGRLMIPTSDDVMLVSQDGVQFTEIPAPSLNRPHYGGGVFLSPGSSGTLQRSDDNGQTWADVNPLSYSVQRCIYAP